jgi:BirA family transcriptional regulator, biotin operon repressor / biotin---[acetyl-CoA-carboxylase] ligase
MTATPRLPLDERQLAEQVISRSGLWRSLHVIDSLASSNATLADRARSGDDPGAVLIAEEQTAGRGRHDRGWSAPQYSSVMTSVLLRPDVPASRWGWVPLAVGLAVADAVGGHGVEATVKWPNDVLVGDRKLAGVLCEVVPTPRGAALVAGWGINVDQRKDELPVPTATSVRVAGGRADRATLAADVLTALEHRYRQWEQDDPDVRSDYGARSSTLGSEVVVSLPGGGRLHGRATGLDDSGGLVVTVGDVEHVVAAADVVHVRPAPE